MIDNNFALFSLNFLSDIYASFFFFFKKSKHGNVIAIDL